MRAFLNADFFSSIKAPRLATEADFGDDEIVDRLFDVDQLVSDIAAGQLSTGIQAQVPTPLNLHPPSPLPEIYTTPPWLRTFVEHFLLSPEHGQPDNSGVQNIVSYLREQY
jgi:hypothetical protein